MAELIIYKFTSATVFFRFSKAHGHGVCTGPDGQGEYAGAWHYGFEVSEGVPFIICAYNTSDAGDDASAIVFKSEPKKPTGDFALLQRVAIRPPNICASD